MSFVRAAIVIAAVAISGCSSKPDAGGLRDSFAQQLQANTFVAGFARSGDDLRFTAPGANGEDKANWRVHFDSAAIEDNSDAAKPYKGTVKSSWYSNDQLVTPRGRDSNLPVPLTSGGGAGLLGAVEFRHQQMGVGVSRPRMRGVQALFLVSAALFISAIAFIVAAARTRVTSPAASTAPPAAPVANMRQLMIAVVGPNAQKVYDAVSTTITKTGAVDVAPKNDQEWAAVAASAAALVESGQLMLSPGRAVDDGQWMRMTQRFINEAKVALDAANKKDADGIFAVGGDLNMTCDSCHETYQRK